MKEQIKELFTKRNDDNPALSKIMRIILFPIFGIWFIFQLCVFSIFLGFAAVIFGAIGALMEIGKLPEHRDWYCLELIIMPLLAPFIWLFRYFYLGEYNVLMD